MVSISWIRVLFLGAWCAYLPLEFEESRDGKREMAAETSQPVTLTSTFFLYKVVTQRSSLGAVRDDCKNRLRRRLQPWSKLLGH